MRTRTQLRTALLTLFVASATLLFGACDSTGTNDNGVVTDSMQILNVTPDVGADLKSTDTSITFTFTDPVVKNEYTRTDVDPTGGERHLIDVVGLFPVQAKNAKALAPNGSLPIALEFNDDRTELTISPEQSLQDGYVYNLYLGNVDDPTTTQDEGTGFYDARFKSQDGARFGVNHNYPKESFTYSVGQNESAPATPSISFDSEVHYASADTIEKGTYDYNQSYVDVPLEVNSIDNSAGEVKGYEVYYRSQNEAGRTGSGDQFVKANVLDPEASAADFEDENGIVPASAVENDGEVDFTVRVFDYPFHGNGGYGPIEWKVRAVSINNVRGDFSSVVTTGDNTAPNLYNVVDHEVNENNELETLTVAFSEALDSQTVDAGAFTLTDENGDPVAIGGATLENIRPEDGGSARVTLKLATPQPESNFQNGTLEVNDAETTDPVTDLAGNGVTPGQDIDAFWL